MPPNPFFIDLSELPIVGKNISGTLPASAFQIEPTEECKPTSDIRFSIDLIRADTEHDDDPNVLVLNGTLHATFELECGRCLEHFNYELDLENYTSEAEIEPNKATMDLTDVLRDDILVALPSYPRCEDGNVEPRECPAQGRFDAVEEQVPIEEETASQDAGVWDALDQLKN